MNLNKQIHLYSVDTSAFYNKNEMIIHKRLSKNYLLKNKLLKKLQKCRKNKDKHKHIDMLNKSLKNTNRRLKLYKKKLQSEFPKNNNIRELKEEILTKRKIISVFDSVLTRTMGIPENTLTEDLFIVQTFFFDIIEDIILNGFIYKNKKYVCFTASAGQIRTKKTVFIKESILKKHQMTLMCGLTIKDINKLGGVNINKYLSYLALCNSATEKWDGFDITKSIVIDDLETDVKGIVDFIDDKTYKIERKKMDIPICHTDGCGMILPKKNKKNLMVRLPWIKGLLSPFPFDKFIKEANGNNPEKNHGLIKDIYGKEHDILKDGIEIIFTKSQFKMYKYYSSWQDYVDKFIKYNCQAAKCNEEEDEFSNAKLNYQMLQTLTDMADKEIEIISKKTKYNIINIGRDRKTMLKVLGVKKSNTNKNYIQQALDIYPELLNDTYSKEILKQVKKSMVKEGRSGKIEINGVYTFIIPDLYAHCEFLFLGKNNPSGLLKDGDVYCNLYQDKQKIACLRSPHLYREWAVRKNKIDEGKSKWFVTNGLYTSCHDLISKILQFDVDGDKSLVVADNTLIEVAERNMVDIVPLYYNMRKAPAETITSKSIYNGLKTAYSGGNIGMISNDITKIWNGEDINLEVIKLLCMENNFTIDYAKTLYKPKRPKDKKKLITQYTKCKLPYFFIYAKDKKKDKVEKINNSVVNRLNKIIPNPNINFNATDLGRFNYRMLMRNKKIELDDDIINKYKGLDLKKHFMITRSEEDEIGNITYLYQEIKENILKVNSDRELVVDVLIEYLYRHKKSNFKTTLWECFGDVIVSNLRNNIADNSTICDVCGKRIVQTNNKTKYCEDCAKEVKREQDRLADKKYKNRIKSEKMQNS